MVTILLSFKWAVSLCSISTLKLKKWEKEFQRIGRNKSFTCAWGLCRLSVSGTCTCAFLSLSIGEQSLTNRGGGNSGDQSFCVRFSYLYYNQLFSIVEQSLNNTVDKAFGSLLPLPTKTSLFDWYTLLQKVTQS